MIVLTLLYLRTLQTSSILAACPYRSCQFKQRRSGLEGRKEDWRRRWRKRWRTRRRLEKGRIRTFGSEPILQFLLSSLSVTWHKADSGASVLVSSAKWCKTMSCLFLCKLGANVMICRIYRRASPGKSFFNWPSQVFQ